MFFLNGTTFADQNAFEMFAEKVAPGHGAEIVAHYPLADYGTAQAAAVAAFTDAGFVCPARRAARAISAAGAPTYLYHFTYGPPSLFGDLGAFHSAEVKFVFGTPGQVLPYPLTVEETVLSRAMMGYWSRLIGGDPNGDGATAWPAYAKASDQTIVLDLELSTKSGLRSEHCDFWDGLDSPG